MRADQVYRFFRVAGNPVEMPIEAYIQPSTGGARNYDITPDGKPFIMAFRSEQSARRSPIQIQVIVNWFEEIKQREISSLCAWRQRRACRKNQLLSV